MTLPYEEQQRLAQKYTQQLLELMSPGDVEQVIEQFVSKKYGTDKLDDMLYERS